MGSECRFLCRRVGFGLRCPGKDAVGVQIRAKTELGASVWPAAISQDHAVLSPSTAVASSVSIYSVISLSLPSPKRITKQYALLYGRPSFVVLLPRASTTTKSPSAGPEKYCLAAKPIIDETDIRLAQAGRDETGKPQLLLFFTLKTRQRMKETTERTYAQHGRMGIVIGGKLFDVPVLYGVISDTLAIRGGFSWDDAVQIAESLNAVQSRPSPASGQN
jgi:hypothetical protein